MSIKSNLKPRQQRNKSSPKTPLFRRAMAMFLCLCMTLGIGQTMLPAVSAADASHTKGVTRVADPDTMDSYQDLLLTDTDGSRYAGRVWTDKTVFAYGASQGGVTGNQVPLEESTDGIQSSVGFSSDFLHVFSALTSTQVVNEFPLSPVDLVIAFDMSASMAQDTRYGVDSVSSGYMTHYAGGEFPSGGIPMADRIAHSRIQLTIDAINKTVTDLMKQNPQNRVAVIGYGANATVIMPLAHWEIDEAGQQDGGVTKYLTVSGMETLPNPGDLKVNESGEWVWINNRDECFTVHAEGKMNTWTKPLDQTNINNTFKDYSRTVSNNVEGRADAPIKAFPGVEHQSEAELAQAAETYKEASNTVQTKHLDGKNKELATHIEATQHLAADEYVGYFTNTQGGIYLAYKQLADSEATTYTDNLSNGTSVTVARIPAAIIMSDGGANFAFNATGDENNQPQDYQGWKEYFGSITSSNETDGPTYHSDQNNANEKNSMDSKHRLYQTSDNTYKNPGDEWYNVWLPGTDTLKFAEGEDPATTFKGVPSLYNPGADYYKTGSLTDQTHWYNAGVLYSSDNDITGTPGTTLEALLTASYMSTVAEKHYDNGWQRENATQNSRGELSTYTMSVDTHNVPQWGRWRMYPILDPAEYPLDSAGTWSNDPSKFAKEFGATTFDNDGQTEKTYRQTVFNSLQTSWTQFKQSTQNIQAAMQNTNIKIIINPLPEGHIYHAGGGDEVSVTQADVIGNIAYNDSYQDVTAVDIGRVFDDILEDILDKAFIPVSGYNDAGVGDSVTYQDPIGDYMEVKDQAITATLHHTKEEISDTPGTYDMAMVLFGEMHGLTRAGVYDFQWNDAFMKKHKPGDAEFNPLPVGWYRGEAEAEKYTEYTDGVSPGPAQADTVEYIASDNITKYFNSEEEAWKAGWTLRLSFKELLQYVPIADNEADTPNDLTEQEKHTVYTMYRFQCTEEEGDRLRVNPTYGSAVPEEIEQRWQEWYETHHSYPEDNGLYRESPGVYRLNDIRVWVEDYGEYRDKEDAIVPFAGLYESSLYANIPAAAIPTQSAEITMGRDGVASYKTNVNDPSKASDRAPIRLFYAVGLDDALMVNHEDGTQTVDVSRISEEYLAGHTTANGHIWFDSNFFSKENDNGLGGTDGDPTVTFSANPSNRYYLYQKPTPLFREAYQAGPDGLTKITDPENAYGLPFMGVYESESSYKGKLASANGTITDDYNTNYKVQDNGVVFLKSDMMDPDGTTPKSFEADSWYYLLTEFYVPNPDKEPTMPDGSPIQDDPLAQGADTVRLLVPRTGSSLGAGSGEGLACWTDINGNIRNLRYNAHSEDRTHGLPTLEKLTKTGETLKEYLKTSCGFSDGEALNDEAAYWEKIQKQYAEALEAAKGDAEGELSESDFNAAFHFSLAVRPGVIRTDDSAQGGIRKTPNTTQTADHSYAAVLSKIQSQENTAAINDYLGNNGRLEIPNGEIMVTKTLNPPLGYELTEEQKDKGFWYQIYLYGMTGDYSATQTWYNEYAKVWQKKMGAVDVSTDNSGLLTDPENEKILYYYKGDQASLVVEENGVYYLADEEGNKTEEQCPVQDKNQLFYVYLPGNSGSEQDTTDSRRVWQDAEWTQDDPLEHPEHSGRTTYIPQEPGMTEVTDGQERLRYENENRPAGTRSYWVSDAELIPVSEVNDGWTHTSSEYTKLDHLTIMIRKPGSDEADEILSPYSTKTHFLTKTLKFGENANEDGDNRIGQELITSDLYDPSNTSPANTAEFTLKTGEGLLFTGLNANAYRITEKLSEADLNAGYTLEKIERTGEEPKTDFETPGIYSITGAAGAEEQIIHYINTFLTGDISVTKTLTAEDGTDITPQDLATVFDFTLKLEQKNPDSELPFEPPFQYTIMGPDNTDPITGELNAFDSTHSPDSNGVYAITKDTWYFPLKAGQTMTVTGLPAGVEFTFELTEHESGNPVYEVKCGLADGELQPGRTVTGTVIGGGEKPARVMFENLKTALAPVTVPLELEKILSIEGVLDTGPYYEIGDDAKPLWDGSSGWNDPYYRIEKDAYTFKVVPDSHNPENDPIKNLPNFRNGALVVTNEAAYDSSGRHAKATIFPDDFQYTQAGVYKYTLTEEISHRTGVTTDNAVYTITVVVTERFDEDGYFTGYLDAHLSLEKDGQPVDKASFVNIYNPVVIRVPITAIKFFDGGIMQRGQFTFELTGESAVYDEGVEDVILLEPMAINDGSEPPLPDPDVIPPAEDSVIQRNDENGVVDFGYVTFNRAGTYTYTMREVPGANNRIVYDNHTYTITIRITRDSTGALHLASMTITADPDDITPESRPVFRNLQKTVSLTVSKTVTGTGGDRSKEFHFHITVDPEISGTYGGMSFLNGVADVTLKDGESATATGLPPDIRYTVTEKEANQGGYTTESTNESGSIPADSTAEAEFINDRPAPLGDLSVTKTVTGDAGEKTKEFRFHVKLSDTTVNGTFGDMTFTDGEASFTLHHGQTKRATGLPAGITYTVTEEDANLDGYTTESHQPSGSIPENGEVHVGFTNDKPSPPPQTGSLKVTKTVTGEAGDKTREFRFRVELSDKTINGTYGEMTFTDGIAEFGLKDGQSKTATGLPAGITYTVTELNAEDYTVTSGGEKGTIPENNTAVAGFVNHKNPPKPEQHFGGLEVAKTVTGSAGEKTKEFHFTVTLDDTGVNGTYGDMTFTDGIAKFTLKDGESKTAEGLPAGTAYTVTETEANEDGYDTRSSGESGSIPEDSNASAEFVNHRAPEEEHRTGSLKVEKTVKGWGEKEREFHFRVELKDKSISGKYGGMTFKDGIAEFTLKHGESLEARNLPEGTIYTVTEEEANQEGYTTEAMDDEGVILYGETETAEFVNSRPNRETPGEPGEPSEPSEPTPTPEEPTPTPSESTSPEPGESRNPYDPTPQTGDNSHLAVWIALAAVSLTGIAVLLAPSIGKRKKR